MANIKEQWGVPPPYEALLDAIEARHGKAERDELEALYRRAAQRYGRAGRLNELRRMVKEADRRVAMKMPPPTYAHNVERWRAILADPLIFIDRADEQDEEPPA